MRTFREEIEMIIENQTTNYPDGTVRNAFVVTESIIKEIKNILPEKRQVYAFENSFENGCAYGFNDCLDIIEGLICNTLYIMLSGH